MIKKIYLLFVFLLVLQFVSAFSVGDFFNDLKNNPDKYYVLCESENLEIISRANSFANSFDLTYSSEMIENKNPIAIIISPSSFMEYFYYFENPFSYIESKQTDEVNLLVLYFINQPDEKILNEISFAFDYLINDGIEEKNNYLIFDENGIIPSETFGCQGFVNISIFEKNIFNNSRGIIFEDECLDEKTLLKMDCVNELKFNSVNCEKGCDSGRCGNAEESVFSLIKKWTLGKSISFKRVFDIFKINLVLLKNEI